MQIGGSSAERTSQWVEDDGFIEVAIRHATQRLRGSAQGSVPVFARLLNGTDCDARWSWHAPGLRARPRVGAEVDPKAATWEQVATEVCDASPGYIEQNTEHWMSSPGKWPLGVSHVSHGEIDHFGGRTPFPSGFFHPFSCSGGVKGCVLKANGGRNPRSRCPWKVSVVTVEDRRNGVEIIGKP